MNASPAVIWIYFGVLYALYYIATFDSPKLADRFHRRFGHDRGEMVRIATSRIAVFIFLGVVPWITVPILFGEPNPRWGVTALPSGREILYAGGVSIVAVGLILINPRRSGFTVRYPQMRIRRWGGLEISVNLLTWVLYLAAYETMFRGYLLFGLKSLGMTGALAVVLTLYIIIHLTFGGLVTWGTIPFGLAVGWLCWISESFWTAYLAHIAVAFTHTIQSAVLNPEMEFPFPRFRRRH